MTAIKLLEETRYYVELRMNAKNMINLDFECERDLLARIDALLKTGDVVAHWPDDFDCGMKHAYEMASIHAGLPQALSAIKAEIDGQSLHPTKRECPNCGLITDAPLPPLPEAK